MKIENTREVENNVYSSGFNVLEVTDVTKELIKDFGEPVINIGGTVEVEVTKRVSKTETKPVFEADGVTPVYEDDGVTQKTETVTVTEDVIEKQNVKVSGDIFKRLPSDFPITKSFSKATNGEISKEVAIGWTKAVDKRIEDQLAKLRLNVDDFSGKDEKFY